MEQGGRTARTIVLLAVLVSIIAVGGCSPQQEDATSVQEVAIGGIFALTGYGAPWGEAELRGAELAIAQANAAHPEMHFTLIAEDSHTIAKDTIIAYHKLATTNVVAIIGPTWEEGAAAIAPRAEQDTRILITPSSYEKFKEQQSQYLFSTYPPLEYQIQAWDTFADEKHLRRFAVVATDDLFGQLMTNKFIAHARGAGWQVTQQHPIITGTTDFGTIALKISSGDVDAVYAQIYPGDIALLMRDLRSFGSDVPVFGIDSVENDDLFEAGRSVAEGIVYSWPVESSKYSEFLTAYQKTYGANPASPSAATAYDAANLLIESVQQGHTNAEEIAQYLHSRHVYEGVSGNLSFSNSGILKSKEYYLKTVKDGVFVPLNSP